MAVLLASTALVTPAARAVDATWTGGGAPVANEWTQDNNWSSNALPDGTATFTNNGAPATVEANGAVDLGAVNFVGATGFTINTGSSFVVTGAGVSNNSTTTQTINLGGSTSYRNSASASGGIPAVTYINTGDMSFFNTSTAGNALINNIGDLEFNDNSSAGSAEITNNGTLNFNNNSTAGSGLTTIGNASGKFINFFNNSSAGSATISNSGTLSFNNSSTASSAQIIGATGSATNFNNNATAGSSTITLLGTGTLAFNNSSTAGTATINSAQVGGSITFNDTSNAGSANIVLKQANLIFNNSASAGSATITMPDATHLGTITFNNTSTAGSSNITVVGSLGVGGTLTFLDSSTAGSATLTTVVGSVAGGQILFGSIGGTDTATAANANITNHSGGTTEFTAATTAGHAVITNDAGGFLQFGDSGGGNSTATAANSTVTNNGTASFNALTTAGNAVITTNSGGHVFFFDSSTGGAAQFITGAGGTFDMSLLTASGMTAGSIAGSGSYVLGNKNLTVGSNNLSTNVSGVISGTDGSLTKVGTGTLALSGINTYTGATTVNGGTLEVDGSIANTSGVTVNSGGTLSGTGIVDPTTTAIMNGGTLAPGPVGGVGTLNIIGNLAFQSGALYLVQVTPSSAASTNVSDTATLAGATVKAVFANGSYINKQYTILTANSVSGKFGTLTNANLPTDFSDSLSYDTTHAYLNLTLSFVPPNFGSGLSGNQQAVANALTNFFNTTGGIPMVYGTLTPAGLTQASGELATGSQQTTFEAMDLFLGLLTDPFMNRTGGATNMPGAAGYAEDGDASAYAATRKTDAFAMFTKAPPAPFVQRWSVWAAGFGGSQSTSGNAVVGSNDTTSSVYSTAVGADYLFSPNTIAGFALAGGGTNFSVLNGGSGRSDLFQAGAYLRHTNGPAYITAALAYGWQDVTTDRAVTAAGLDQLRAEFNANTYSGRLEGGYRFVAPWTGGIGITPYAAAQFITFDLPAYAESVASGSPAFALAYAAKDVTDVRSELGFRTDKSFLVQDGVLTLRSRFAWAHDFDPDRSIAATFQALPGASFVVNGAAQASDSALTTAAVEMKWKSGWSVAGTFEGEFSDVTSSYAGKGVLRYQW